MPVRGPDDTIVTGQHAFFVLDNTIAAAALSKRAPAAIRP